MESYTYTLLVTANVGSLFDNVGEIQNLWLKELYKTIDEHKPQFVALHFQEVGGKDYTKNMDSAEDFFRIIKTSKEMQDFDRAYIYVDNNFQAEDSFTALGSMYFIHKTLTNILRYDFNVKDFRPVSGKNSNVGALDNVTTVEKEKFPKNFWTDFKWSRKGFMRTRWLIHNQRLDLVNIHLFHDASNLIACSASPSIYSTNRKEALTYVIERILDNQPTSMPFFLFGDFNFRLDAHSLVQHLSTSAEVQIEKKDKSNKVERITWNERDNDHKELLKIEEKLFTYPDQAVFQHDNVKALLKYDKEVSAFHDVIREEDITFPPSYPYSEDITKPTEYMNTRFPAWCDRILMSHSVQDILLRTNEDSEHSLIYNTMGPDVCMGDHKPVFLLFALKTNNH